MAERVGQVAVIFVAQRRRGAAGDPAGYSEATRLLEALAARQPGYRGHEGVRGEDGRGITVSYWADEAAARAWRDQPDHARLRAAGRERWYDAYTVQVVRIERDYAWEVA